MVVFAAALAGLVLAALVVRANLRSMAREAAWFDDKAIVTGVLARCEQRDSGSDAYYVSAVEYTAADGFRYQITGSDFPFRPAEVGRPVDVAYDPRLPSEARLVPTEEPVYTVPIVLGILTFGLVFSVIFAVAG